MGEGSQSLQGAYVMHLATSCQLQHIAHTVGQMETKETLGRGMQHIQTVSKTYFYNKILTSKIFGNPLGDLPNPVCSTLILRYPWDTANLENLAFLMPQ
jgi:hypothetical protein